MRGVKQEPQPPIKLHRSVSHGTTGYYRGCRCEVCLEAERAANAKYRKRKKAGLVAKPISEYKTVEEERVERLLEIAAQPIELEIDGVVYRS